MASMAMRQISFLILFSFFIISFLAHSTRCHEGQHDHEDHHDHDEPHGQADAQPISETEIKEVEHRKGSVCSYCSYCKFCKLCDKDCPCEKSAKKPNCHMCKYCKYCYLCTALCDTICKPGGIVDRVSAAIVNALPSFDSAEVTQDLDSVKDYVKRDEL